MFLRGLVFAPQQRYSNCEEFRDALLSSLERKKVHVININLKARSTCVISPGTGPTLARTLTWSSI